MQGEIKGIESLNAKLFIVGNGEPRYIENFKQSTGYRGEVYTDPSLQSHKALNFSNSKLFVMNPKVISRGVGAFLKGHKQKGIQGNPWQQGGVVVVNSQGEVLFYQSLASAGEPIAMDRLIASLSL